MRKFNLILFLLTSIMGHAADLTVDGVVYSWMPGELAYAATGWDNDDPREELHIYSSVNGLDVTRIATAAFEDNETLRSVEIDEGITAIGENAFCRCHNLRRVVLPVGLEKISEEAFAFCSALKTMTIPASVTVIESHAFAGCTAVTDVYFRMTEEEQLNVFDWWDGDYPRDGEDDHGGLEFNRSRLRDPENGTIIHVPDGTYDIYSNSGKLEAWLLQEDVAYPLWWIVNFGTVGEVYTVSDDIMGVYVDIDGNLYAKDDNHWLVPDVVGDGEVDFMASTDLMRNRSNVYDQSNWVAVYGLSEATQAELSGHIINGGTLTGTLVDKINPMIEVTSECIPESGAAATYVANTYIPASFMGSKQRGADGHTYAFVRPKPQEYMMVDWAVYNETDEQNEFYVPKPDNVTGHNTVDLKGGIIAWYDLYECPPVPSLVDKGLYSFRAINRYALVVSGEDYIGGGAPRKEAATFEPYVDGGLSDLFIVYPLDLSDDPIITAIDKVLVDRRDDSYCDLQGRRLTGKPATAGIYIHNGKKIAMF